MTFADIHRKHPEHREELEERAAIMHIDGQMRRDLAEQEAANIITKKYKLFAPERFR